jgi:hypothetical protein
VGRAASLVCRGLLCWLTERVLAVLCVAARLLVERLVAWVLPAL